MKINGPYFLNAPGFVDINSAERKIFLQLINAINDQGFYEYVSRGAGGIYTFETDEIGYSISFEGFKLKLIFNVSDDRFYLRYDEKIIDAFLLKTWADIDNWIAGKDTNIRGIGLDPLFENYKNKIGG
jgi:hypothetical protein